LIAQDKRFFEETSYGSWRTAGQIDRDRLLYSPHLARLAEVTQVRAMDGGYLVHNRLTYSLKVSQLSRRIAEKLINDWSGKRDELDLDPDVAEAAGLAHDMGHPPFGHIAEEELNELLQKKPTAGGYEGNAQTFRIVTRLSVSDSAPKDKHQSVQPALNVSRATLNGILKYPWLEGSGPDMKQKNKWGAYKSESKFFDWAREGSGNSDYRRSLTAEVMDWADDITYAIHDMVDFHCAGLIPLHLIADGLRSKDSVARAEVERFFDGAGSRDPAIFKDKERYRRLLGKAFDLLTISGPYQGTLEENRDLWYFTSELISLYTQAIQLKSADALRSEARPVTIEPDLKDQTRILKQLTWHYVICHSDLATMQYGQRRMIRELFEVYCDAARKEKLDLFPIGFAQMIKRDQDDTLSERWAADFISALTEREVYKLHRRLIAPAG